MLRSILLSKSLISDFNSLLTFSIFILRLFSTFSILLSRSFISDFKLASTFSSLRLNVFSKYSISLYVNSFL
ncbi:hypothetical protein bcCo53_001453 (plasmid) [Borrelia coriaceae]|nr:hypothetical protein bcCo53_001453 [Borrelia coriaceae]